jgi:hypothetical protein
VFVVLVVYVVLTSIMAVSAASIACLNFLRHPMPVAAAQQVRVPHSWIVPLGIVMLAGALGLVAGFVVPPLGVAAAAGLVLYFVGAIIAHLRVGDFHLGPPSGVLVMAAATLAATVAHRAL